MEEINIQEEKTGTMNTEKDTSNDYKEKYEELKTFSNNLIE